MPTPSHKAVFLLFTLLFSFHSSCFSFTGSDTLVKISTDKIKAFASKLETIRTTLKIPALSAAIMQGDEIIWANGFGYADLQNKIAATENTTYRIASLTKTFTSTLVMKLIEEGKLTLEDPISNYGVTFRNDEHITVRHLLTHTSEGRAGSFFQYNGFRFGKLGIIAEKASGQPFYGLLFKTILEPLQMASTAPDIPLYDYYRYMQQNKQFLPYFHTAFTNLAKPYELDDASQIIESQYLNEFGAFGGLISSVKDILKYAAAIDENLFISKQTQQKVFSPNLTLNKQATPYGLGWFVGQYGGVDVYWHFGQTKCESALFIKIPSLQLSFVVLANTDKLSSPFPLGEGDLLMSPVGQLFYKCFVNKDASLKDIDYTEPKETIQKKLANAKNDAHRSFYNKEMIVQASMYLISNETKAKQFYSIYESVNKVNSPQLFTQPLLSQITQVGINKELQKDFHLTIPTKVQVYGVGENCSFDGSEWCDYGWIENRDTQQVVWDMRGKASEHAGGALKNQLVTTTIDLPAGNYKLHYKSDYAHSYNHWDSIPPHNSFYGIAVFIAKP